MMGVVGLHDKLSLDSTKPDGTPRKLLDVRRLTAPGWEAKTTLSDGIEAAYADILTRRSLS